ncbi:MAG TPA: hypothetical protein ENN46_00695 [Candidatus Woesearchaeota archaeon]|nr:hypothetical protein [Candidatus Woesearchaeota archaeon]
MAEDKEISKEEQIGFHKGSISVLSKERAELLKIVSVVEQLIQMHLKALSELGVSISEEQNPVSEKNKDLPKQKKPPIDELLQ